MKIKFQKIGFIALILYPIVGFSQVNKQNIALGKPVMSTSENPKYPATNAVDGKITRESKWMTSAGKAPHILEINLEKYYNISELRFHSGILDTDLTNAEKEQAKGLWSVKSFKMQYWDDASWTDFPKTETLENRLATVVLKFATPITTFKIRMVSDDGENINVMELEVFGELAKDMPAPPVVGSDLLKKLEITENQNAIIKVKNNIVGKSLKFVGYNQGYFLPGFNASGWLEYSNVNSLRVWTSLGTYAPIKAVQVDAKLNSVEEFDKRKGELRANPENNAFLKWDLLLPIYSKADGAGPNGMVLEYIIAELKRLNIKPILQINSTEFDDTWATKWQQWQRFYSLAYQTAKMGDVDMFAMMNEPNHPHAGPMKLDQWISGMQIVSDAVHAAIDDVNKKYHKNLKAKFVGPVTAGQNTDWWVNIVKSIRIDYHGKTLDHDLIDIFSTHSYNSPAAGYASRVSNIRKLITENHPKGNSLPIVFTELGRWMNAYLIDKEETMDSPSLFTEWAGIYANNMKNGAYGMWAFKMANTTSDIYTRGIKSGHHYTWKGKRIVEDAYENLALNKKVQSSSASNALLVVDGDKSDASTWLSDAASGEKWVEIDLGSSEDLGSAVIYTGSDGGTYTAPDRIRNFKLQYWSDNSWKDIAGTEQKSNKYAQVFLTFKNNVSTTKVRFISSDDGILKVREIKLFAKGDGPSDKPNYNISGIQRTGEVVRLFAKGFKEERNLYEVSRSVDDIGLDTYTSFDEKSGNYYMWLVQRGMFNYNLDIDLSDLNIEKGAPVTAEKVDPLNYGEVTTLATLEANKKINLTLTPQSVTLLTIASGKTKKQIIYASADASVSGGNNKTKTDGKAKELSVSLNAQHLENNNISYISFKTPNDISNAKRVILNVNGKVDLGEKVYRLHVYAIPSASFDENKLSWENASQLDTKEAFILDVGQKVAVAGELAFDNQERDHYLDITDLVKKHAAKDMTFVLIRETRELGDDQDKGRKVIINSKESDKKPKLEIWTNQK